MSTGARVGGVRPQGIPRESWLRRKTIKSEAARRVREVTDNRTSEPTPEQVEAAAKALRADEGFMAEVHSALEVSWSEYIARLVLVAAQGAAPQAEALPSSGVDEDKLGTVIDKALIRHGEMAGMSNQERWDARDDISRAVVAYLRGES